MYYTSELTSEQVRFIDALTDELELAYVTNIEWKFTGGTGWDADPVEMSFKYSKCGGVNFYEGVNVTISLLTLGYAPRVHVEIDAQALDIKADPHYLATIIKTQYELCGKAGA